MRFRPLFFLCVFSFSAITLAIHAQDRFASVEIRTTKVADHVYMLEGRGGNIGVCTGDDGLVMVDSQFEPLAEKIQAALDKLASGKLQFLLNTHHHGDHTGGNPVFGRNAPIVAHENVRKRLLDSEQPHAALPVVTFKDGLTLNLNQEEIRVLHLPPGHTDGDSVVFFKHAKVVHMGDHFFAGRFPFVDLGSGGDVAGYIENVRAMLEQITPEMKIIPGHGPLSTKGDLESFHNTLVETVAIIQKRIEARKSLAEIQAEGLDAKWKSWGGGFISTERWIETVFKSLTR